MKIAKLVVASHNQGKIDEIKKMLSPYQIEVISARELNLPDVEETGNTFTENAALKAEQLSAASGLPCLADDSGLCVNALGGRPGVYSARYSEFEKDGKIERDFSRGMDKLLAELSAINAADRSAYFACVLAFKVPGKACRFFEGRINGAIAHEKSGDGGFGFDPLFIPDGFDKTFAHFTKDEKAAVSHRGRAFEKFINGIFNAD